MKIVEKGGSVGLIRGVECPAWIMAGNGQRFDYIREAKIYGGRADLGQLSDDEQLISPGVIYKKASPETAPPCCAGECAICT